VSCIPQNLDKCSKYNCPGSLYKCVLSAEGRPEAILKTTQLHEPRKPANLAWPESIWNLSSSIVPSVHR